MKTITLLLFAASLQAQTLHPIAMKPPGTNEAIAPDVEIRYWRAQLAANAAKINAEKADTEAKEAEREVLKQCSGDLIPVMDKRIICAAKPK